MATVNFIKNATQSANAMSRTLRYVNMNSTSERKYSLDELKQMNSRDLTEAGEGERHILLTDRNWTAVLNLLARLSAQQLETQAGLTLLLTRPDAEELLRRIDRNAQTRLRDLNAEMEAFAQQAGNLSGRFSSAADRLASSTERELTSLTRSTRDSLDAMQRKTESQLEALRRSTIRWLRIMGIACIAAVAALTILYAVTMLRRPA